MGCRRLYSRVMLASWIGAILYSPSWLEAQESPSRAAFTLARVKYAGGGDWYNDPSEIPNLLSFLREHTNLLVGSEEAQVAIGDKELFSYPFLFLTGHGNILFSDEEASRLRRYLEHGWFLYADDDYGMDEAFRREMKKVFPDKEWVEIPFDHGLFHCHFEFPKGLPKIHEHDGGSPQAFGIFHEGRLVVLYTFETNISDGWASPEVHGDPPEIREQALKMGTNIVVWALTH